MINIQQILQRVISILLILIYHSGWINSKKEALVQQHRCFFFI